MEKVYQYTITDQEIMENVTTQLGNRVDEPLELFVVKHEYDI